MTPIKRIAQLKTPQEFQDHLDACGARIPFDEALESTGPLAQPFTLNDGRTIGNRFCILPMEGWDGTTDGFPTDLTVRRWERFGRSGAKLIWGGEAVAVRPDGRANPNQLMLNRDTAPAIAGLLATLRKAHGDTRGLLVGLQLTHSGRFARPTDKAKLEPKILYRHPILDAKFGLPPAYPILSDSDVSAIVADFVAAGRLAAEIGFDFVDLKHCHGYLGHEFLSAVDRPGRYGGSFENRTRFLREIAAGLRTSAPALALGVRFSAFDFAPFRAGGDGIGEASSDGDYPCAFGGDGTGTGIDLAEPIRFVELLGKLGIRLVCTTAGSPYYTPHLQRPALFPPSDGYLAPEEPLLGVARQIDVTAKLRAAAPSLFFVGSGYTYLQEWLPHVGQAAVRHGLADSVGLGRMVLSYPELPADVLAGRAVQMKRLCRTFSDCTTAPRNGLASGCYPLDPHYKGLPEARELLALKRRKRTSD